ncbi:MAG: hypothetical protein M3Y87_15995, partial [Myxococcota bacterium]|nr:hypothetical protein [Myxococcota bacterium]
LAQRCDVAAYLRFARVPFAASAPARETIVLGDLRYDRERGPSFAEIEVPREPPAECPSFVPPWEPWRAGDLLSD